MLTYVGHLPSLAEHPLSCVPPQEFRPKILSSLVDKILARTILLSAKRAESSILLYMLDNPSWRTLFSSTIFVSFSSVTLLFAHVSSLSSEYSVTVRLAFACVATHIQSCLTGLNGTLRRSRYTTSLSFALEASREPYRLISHNTRTPRALNLHLPKPGLKAAALN